MNHKKRIAKVRDFIDKRRLSAIIIKNPSNIFYLTGLLDIEGVLIIDGKEMTFFVPALYYNEATDLASFKMEMVIYKRDAFIKFLRQYKRIGFIDTEITFSGHNALSRENTIVPLPDFIKDIRKVKEALEIKNIERALKINRRVFKDIREFIEDGEKETVVAGRIHYLIRKYGGRKEAFEPIIASGVASSYPHHTNRDIKIVKGKPVVVDAGVDYNGYKSDLTRTFLPGYPEKRLKDIYKILEDVQRKVLDFIQVGMVGGEIHSYAAGLLKQQGMDRYFVHGLGHGVGIDIHELPVLAPGSKDIIEKGCVFTVEPGIYLPGVGGIRLEDMVLLT